MRYESFNAELAGRRRMDDQLGLIRLALAKLTLLLQDEFTN